MILDDTYTKVHWLLQHPYVSVFDSDNMDRLTRENLTDVEVQSQVGVR